MKIQLIFAWYDLWMGLFIDRKKQTVYLFLIPMVGIKFHWHHYKYIRGGAMYNVVSEECSICKHKKS
jgi:hypothetical protein